MIIVNGNDMISETYTIDQPIILDFQRIITAQEAE